MTKKQENFVDEFIIAQGNSAQAARRAGYSSTSARVTASRLLNNPEIRAEIDSRLDELKSEKIADVREVMEFLSAVMRGEIEETIVTHSGKKITVTASCASRLKAAENLLKVYGAFRRSDEPEKPSGTELFVATLSRISEKMDGKGD